MEYDHPPVHDFTQIRAEDRTFTRIPNIDPTKVRAITEVHQQHPQFGPWGIIAHLKHLRGMEPTLDEVCTVLYPE